MDTARLAAIRAREQAASRGPWRVVGGSGFEIYAPYDEDARQHGALDMFIASFDADARSHPNAAFIAAARADVPDLLAEIDRLRAVVPQIETEIARLTAENERLVMSDTMISIWTRRSVLHWVLRLLKGEQE